jgi:uncharacterized repeat protein (TIGR02543 family)/uncharacterized protein (TIGR02145 family)
MSHTGDEVVTAVDGVLLDNSETLDTIRLNANDAYLMLLPQTIPAKAVSMEVTWEVDGVGRNQTVSLPEQTWVPGKRYDYSIGVSLEKITLDPVVVNPWGTDDRYKPCTLTYKANDGTDSEIIEYRTTNIALPVLPNTFTRAGYVFDGWNTEADGSGDIYDPGDSFMSNTNSNATLYAMWEPDPSMLANCYIVTPGDSKTFPVKRAYEFDETNTRYTTMLRTGSTYTDEFETEIVWADFNTDIYLEIPPVKGSGKNAVVTVKAKAGAEGNAVVAIKKATAPQDIVWSYHIWVTGYDPNDTRFQYTNRYNTNNKGNYFVFMDRNLGATFAGTGRGLGTGLFYQWGRKDPFPATNYVTAVVTSASNGTIAYAIQHPNEFLTAGSSSSYDWHFAKRDNTLWGHNDVKSIYDPCPAGWRVPVNSGSFDTSPWYGFSDSSNKPANLAKGSSFSTGYNWGTNAVYPAVGVRGNASNTLNNLGTHGHYWSASPYSGSSNYASSLYFGSGNVLVSDGGTRAYGFSVRCVKE